MSFGDYDRNLPEYLWRRRSALFRTFPDHSQSPETERASIAEVPADCRVMRLKTTTQGPYVATLTSGRDACSCKHLHGVSNTAVWVQHTYVPSR